MSGPSTTMPAATARLFEGYEPELLLRPEHRSFLLGRLLEEGNAEDLRWLAQEVGEAALAGWLAGGGAASLSRRSRAFWALVLDSEVAGTGVAEELWPL